MKRAIEIYPTSGDFLPFELEVNDPALVRTIVVAGIEVSRIIVASTMGAAPQVQMQAVPALAIEVNPDGIRRKRSFVWLSAGKAVEYPGKLEYQASYIDEATGCPYFLYEANPRT